ncbi:hypothetical protein A3K63_04740 [Candidatus Micrarchaeota archaeon RBG_16_49_10]|nr:MAG: hypothetical protein A3K63_04740 [Candidatus Micrarchaeota archaeon RBG_16_49_10]
MLLPCESIIKLFLPAIRAGVTKKLYRKHKMNQVEIAEKLGITQAAVSKYLSDDYGDSIKKLERTEQVKEVVERVSKSVVSNKTDVKSSICKSCGQIYGGPCLVSLEGD